MHSAAELRNEVKEEDLITQLLLLNATAPKLIKLNCIYDT